MKFCVASFILLFTMSACCATQATKAYVDNTASNTLTAAKSYSDVKASEVANAIPSTNDILNIIDMSVGPTNSIARYRSIAWTNEIGNVITSTVGFSSWHEELPKTYPDTNFVSFDIPVFTNNSWTLSYKYVNTAIPQVYEVNSYCIGWNGSTLLDFNVSDGHTNAIARFSRMRNPNKFGIAMLSDIPSTNDFATTSITNNFASISITNGLLSIGEAYQMETNSPARHSEYVSEQGPTPSLFYSLNPVLLDIKNIPPPIYLAINDYGWPESKGVFAKISVPASYQFLEDNIVLLGYGAWPTSCTFQAYVWRCGEKYYVNIMSILED